MVFSRPQRSRFGKGICSREQQVLVVEDNIYDYPEGTPEHQEACRITDAWGAVMDELEHEIFAILRREGVEIPKTGRIGVLVPFMERNGYCDRGGWWVPKKPGKTDSHA